MSALDRKKEELSANLRGLGSVAVAFSGGVDSSLLLYLAHRELEDSCIAFTADSPLFPVREITEARTFCERYHIRQTVMEHDVFAIEGFSTNPNNRCYLCKKDMFFRMKELATGYGLSAIVEGSNVDDENDYRPGREALRELGIVSPLFEAGFSKAEIRELSRELGLPSAEKQSFACLASRFPFGEKLDLTGLTRVDKAEQFLLDEGLQQVRVRSHGNLARIETDGNGIAVLADPELCSRVHDVCISLGFSFVTLDLSGYRAGSMNYLAKSSPTTTRISPSNS